MPEAALEPGPPGPERGRGGGRYTREPQNTRIPLPAFAHELPRDEVLASFSPKWE